MAEIIYVKNYDEVKDIARNKGLDPSSFIYAQDRFRLYGLDLSIFDKIVFVLDTEEMRQEVLIRTLDTKKPKTISFSDFKKQKEEKLNQPDPDQVCLSEKLEKFFHYTLSYQFDDSDWVTSIWARNDEEALRKVEAMKKTLTFEGQILSEQEY